MAGGGRLLLLPVTLPALSTRRFRGSRTAASHEHPHPEIFSPENKVNPYSLSWQILTISEVPPYNCTNAPDAWAAAAIQTLISL